MNKDSQLFLSCLIVFLIFVFVAPILVLGENSIPKSPGWYRLGGLNKINMAGAYDPDNDICYLFGGAGPWWSHESNHMYTYKDGYLGYKNHDVRPSKRYSHSIAFHEGAGKLVLFGGQDNYYLKDTWLFDGTVWEKGSSGPGSRAESAMAYDPIRKVVVLFGGISSANELNDTWTYNGANWKKVSNAGPDARFSHCLAWDPGRQAVILFGGLSYDKNTFYGDTWKWDGSKWAKISETGPKARADSSMAYCSKAKGIILYGGRAGGSTMYGDTWKLGSGGWQKITTGPSPGKRSDHVLIRANKAGDLVLHGGLIDYQGFNYKSVTNEVWAFNGAKWNRKVEKGPVYRQFAAVAYDAVNKSVVMHGGVGRELYLADTWQFKNGKWTEIKSTKSVPARSGHAIAYDRKNNRIVLYGGKARIQTGKTGNYKTVYFDDTWELKNGRWKRISSTAPAYRQGHSMFYDPYDEQIILFEGFTPNAKQGDNKKKHYYYWSLNKNKWSAMTSINNLTRQVTGSLFDHEDYSGKLCATKGVIYEWTGNEWTRAYNIYSGSVNVKQIFCRNNKGPLYGFMSGTAKAHPAGKYVLEDDIYWNYVAGSEFPEPIKTAGMVSVYNPAGNYLLIFGGGESGVPTDETWIYVP